MASAPPAEQQAPADQAANPNAVATLEAPAEAPIIVVKVAQRGEVERIDTDVTLPAGFQYLIKSKSRDVPNKVGITSDGYDYMNRVMGVSFWMPTVVPDEYGKLVRNPIHRTNGYIYLRMAGTWWNEVGQMVSTFEDIEVNPLAIWAQERVNSYGAVPVMDPDTGAPKLDQNGYPMVTMRDSQFDGKTTTAAMHESKAMKAYMQALSWGIRYAQTVARVRIMKQATGLKSLGKLTAPRQVRVRVVGYKDVMDPVKRVAQANDALKAIFGENIRPENFARMTADEMEAMDAREAEVDEAIEEMGDPERDDEGMMDADGPAEQGGQATLLPDDEFAVQQ